MTPTAAEAQPFAERKLGARGSRSPIPDKDSGHGIGPDARAVLTGIPEWWEKVAQTAGLRGRWLAIENAIEGLPHPPSSTRSEDLTGLTGFDLGARYVASLSGDVRSRHGRHYTPDSLAEYLWRLARLSLGQRRQDMPLPGLVSDPACGAGALLLPPIRQHLRALAGADPRMTLAMLPQLIEGIDSDPAAVWIANVALAAELLPLIARIPSGKRHPLPRLARVGDGLSPPAKPSRVIVMNPPYGRVRLDKAERARWDKYLFGHANLYSLFLASGLERLDDQGVLAALVPTSFLAGRYFAALRSELTQQVSLRDLTFVEERGGVFDGVLQETCLATFTRRRSRRTSIASANGRVTPVAKVSSPRSDRPWVLPRRADDASLAVAAAGMPLTLRSIGWKVSTGPLVWNRRRSDLGRFRRSRSAPVLWAADLDGGQLHRDPSKSSLRWLSLRGSDADVMLLREPAILAQRTTSPEQRRRLVCAELSPHLLSEWGEKIVVENHVNVLRPEEADVLLSRQALTALLSTRTIDRLMRCISGSVAVSAYELESLPLPDAAVLKAWENLRGDDLENVVAMTYQQER